MEFLSRSWSVSALEISKALTPAASKSMLSKAMFGGFGGGGTSVGGDGPILEDVAAEEAAAAAAAVSGGNAFSFACSETSQLILERIMSQSVSNFD